VGCPEIGWEKILVFGRELNPYSHAFSSFYAFAWKRCFYPIKKFQTVSVLGAPGVSRVYGS
jgi:hypothetical protein